MKIGDVEKLTGISSKTIRYYESRGLIDVPRGYNQYREYDEGSVADLNKIGMLRSLGIAIADIRLWKDGVIDTRGLLSKRRRELDDDDRLSRERRERCNQLLADTKLLELPLPLDSEGGRFIDPDDQAFTACEDSNGRVPLALGVDIGTTSISAQLIRLDPSGTTVHTYNIDHHSGIMIDGFPDAYAANAEKLVSKAVGLVRSAVGAYPNIKSIGLTGQMHGIVCLGRNGELLSPLYTWQNGFGMREIGGEKITDILKSITGESLPTGYGLTTLFALGKLGLMPEGTEKICTIADLVVSRLCGNAPVIHPTNAASLGLYDIFGGHFKTGLCEHIGAARLLPTVCGDHYIAGMYDGKVPVSAAIGDNQAGVYGSLADDSMVLVNIGTSGQVSMICGASKSGKGELRPYFNGKFINSGSVLCGGRAYAALADFIADIAAAFGERPSRRDVYSYMNRLAEETLSSPLTVSTRFSGTREDDSVRGSISELGLDNFTPAHFARGVLCGMVEELHTMYTSMCGPIPGDDRRRIVVSGNAMRRNPALRRICAVQFKVKNVLVPANVEEAAFGAALYSAATSGLCDDISSLIKYTDEEAE